MDSSDKLTAYLVGFGVILVIVFTGLCVVGDIITKDKIADCIKIGKYVPVQCRAAYK